MDDPTLRVSCPRCAAEVDEPCTTPTGTALVSNKSHLARSKAYRDKRLDWVFEVLHGGTPKHATIDYASGMLRVGDELIHERHTEFVGWTKERAAA